MCFPADSFRASINTDTLLSMYERHVEISNIIASDGSSLAGINSNYGDTAKIDV